MVAALWLLAPTSMYADGGKREFRGAWMQFVNGMYLGKSTAEIQQMLTHQLDELEKDGANAIIFNDLISWYRRYGFKYAVTGPQMETNKGVLSQWQYLESEEIRRHRIYVKDIK